MPEPFDTRGRHVVTAACLLAVLGTGSSWGSAKRPYVVGPNVQVSLAQSAVQHYETQIAADREDSDHLIACAYVVRPSGVVDNVFYVSFDRGATWASTLTVPVGTDPSCAIGLAG
jgi:hypothetical protein